MDYLKQMMESHSREMELSKMVVERTDNVQVKSIASTLIQRRKRDIDVIEKLLHDDSKNAPTRPTAEKPLLKPAAKHEVKPAAKPLNIMSL
jgi:uncharacterized protein (DUF305 family)